MVGNRKAATRLRFLWGFALGVFFAFSATLGAGCGGISVESVPDDGGSGGNSGGNSGGGSGKPKADCYDLCQKAKAEHCSGAEDKNCEQTCLIEDFLVQQTSCRDEYDDALECTADLDDICDLRTDCGDEIRAQQDCYRRYCRNSNDSLCASWQ